MQQLQVAGRRFLDSRQDRQDKRDGCVLHQLVYLRLVGVAEAQTTLKNKKKNQTTVSPCRRWMIHSGRLMHHATVLLMNLAAAPQSLVGCQHQATPRWPTWWKNLCLFSTKYFWRCCFLSTPDFVWPVGSDGLPIPGRLVLVASNARRHTKRHTVIYCLCFCRRCYYILLFSFQERSRRRKKKTDKHQ